MYAKSIHPKAWSAFVAASILLLGAGCASSTPRHMQGILAEPEEPHAKLEMLRIDNLSEELYPAYLLVIDGEEVRSGARREWRVTPGQHTIGIRPVRKDIERWAPAHARTDNLPDFAEGKIATFTFEAGQTYYFGAYVESFQWNEWKPFVFVLDKETTGQ